MNNETKSISPALSPEREASLVVRSAVPAFDDYKLYKPTLRRDFYYSCAYCTMTEAESQGFRFTIDHYEPQTERPELINDYSNLMYACGECNSRKTDLTPPPAARAAGYRMFRPDSDVHDDHFAIDELKDDFRVKGKTTVGEFSFEIVDLNRAALRRLREIRTQKWECDKFIAHGIAGLKTFPIDRLPPKMKARAVAAISATIGMVEKTEDNIEEILIALAKSELLDLEDADAASRAINRKAKLKNLRAIYPGKWSGRNSKLKKPKS
jgi:hypothetical protein